MYKLTFHENTHSPGVTLIGFISIHRRHRHSWLAASERPCLLQYSVQRKMCHRMRVSFCSFPSRLMFSASSTVNIETWMRCSLDRADSNAMLIDPIVERTPPTPPPPKKKVCFDKMRNADVLITLFEFNHLSASSRTSIHHRRCNRQSCDQHHGSGEPPCIPSVMLLLDIDTSVFPVLRLGL